MLDIIYIAYFKFQTLNLFLKYILKNLYKKFNKINKFIFFKSFYKTGKINCFN